MKKSINAIILAAGKGTRMKSSKIKVAHQVAGKVILQYVIDAVNALKATQTYVVVGHQSESLKALISDPKVSYVEQHEQLGTGHAVLQAAPFFKDKQDEWVLILAGDCPLLLPETLENLVNYHIEKNATGTVLTTKMKDPARYGRLLRDQSDNVIGIKEARDCSAEELTINEINTGVYLFNAGALFSHLENLGTDNDQGEYYLTDIMHMLKEDDDTIAAFCMDDPDQAIGINSRKDQADCNQAIYKRNRSHHMDNGVTLIDPKTTFIDSEVTIGNDTIIHPFTTLKGKTTIGEGCEVGSHCVIENAVIKNGEKIEPFTYVK